MCRKAARSECGQTANFTDSKVTSCIDFGQKSKPSANDGGCGQGHKVKGVLKNQSKLLILPSDIQPRHQAQFTPNPKKKKKKDNKTTTSNSSNLAEIQALLFPSAISLSKRSSSNSSRLSSNPLNHCLGEPFLKQHDKNLKAGARSGTNKRSAYSIFSL